MIYTIRNILRRIQVLFFMDYKEVSYVSDPEEDNFTGIVKDEEGNVAYYEDGKYHRTDGPAVITVDGEKIWFIYGKCHREDGPAIEHYNGHKEWWYNGKPHREDGPAVEYANGEKSWDYNGEWYGLNDDFTTDSWTKKWRLEIFK